MVEQWSPKPQVKGSNPFSPDLDLNFFVTKKFCNNRSGLFYYFFRYRRLASYGPKGAKRE